MLHRWTRLLVIFAVLASPARAATDFISLGHVTGEWFNAKYEGVTPDGIKFTFGPDGVAEISASQNQSEGRGEIWKTACTDDAMSDKRSCALEWYIPAMLILYLDKPDKVRLFCVTNTVGLTGVPQARLGDAKPLTGSTHGCFGGKTASAIEAGLNSGQRLRIRTLHYLNDNVVDSDSLVTPAYRVARDMVNFLFQRREKTISWPGR